MIYKVNNIRKKMFGIVTNLFNDAFNEKYIDTLSVVDGDEIKIAILMERQQILTDKYVLEISNNLDSRTTLMLLTDTVDKETVFTLFLRYNFLTNYLCHIDQDFEIDLPSDNQHFFKEALTSVWKKGVSFPSSI